MYLQKVIKKNLSFLVLVTVLSIVNSILFALIPLLINNTIRQDSFLFIPYRYNWVLFIILLAGSFACKKIFQGYMIRFTNTVLYDLELNMLQQVNESDYAGFNRLDKSQVYTVITDIRVVSQSPRFFIDTINNMVVILISFIYLSYISLVAASALIICAALLALYYYIKNRSVASMLKQSRNLENHFYRYLQDMLTGFKGLKLNKSKREKLFNNYIKKNRVEARDLEIKASVVYMNNELLGNYSWFIILGAIVFGLPFWGYLKPTDIISFIVIILYLVAPVSIMINAVPFYTRISIAMKRIGLFIQSNRNTATVKVATVTGQENGKLADIDAIQFSGVSYSYVNLKDSRQFSINQLDLQINKGDVLFVTGANGSGKSTFLLLLTGLLKPDSGIILVNGKPLAGDHAYELFRNKFSAIYSDSILYSENYDGFDLDPGNEELKKLFGFMQLKEDIITEQNGISTDLSKGQQKRLALIYALLEGREYVVFDEWAAEQDPQFRYYFYNTILPELKVMGKTVIAVTHDDKYFNLASEIIEFNNGSIRHLKTKGAHEFSDKHKRLWF